MKNFTAEKTLDVCKVTVQDVNDPMLFICLQKGRKLEDNSFAWWYVILKSWQVSLVSSYLGSQS